MKARWKTLAIGVLVPVLVTGGIAVAERGDSDRQDDRGERRAHQRQGHPGALGMGILRKLTYAELHIRENGRDKVVRVDNGRLQSASSSSITLKQNDGNVVAVAVNEDTRVLAGRFPFGGGKKDVTDIRRGRVVIAVHEGDKAATLVAAQPRKRWRRRFQMRSGRLPDAFRDRGERR